MLEKCDCPLTDQEHFLCPRYPHKMYKKSHAVCRGEHGEEAYKQYRLGWEMAGWKRREEDIIQPGVKSKMKWSYGITTVLERREDLLPKTIESLKQAGFDRPWLFVDGCDHKQATELYEDYFGSSISGVTIRNPKVKAFGNWMMGLWELYLRNPHSEYFCIFQDDFVACRNIRSYLESLKYPLNGYWNLLTFPQNQNKAPKDSTGFFLSNQRGLGAVALVFNKKAVIELLASEHMVGRPQNTKRGVKAIDGAVVTAMTKVGYKEYVHNPSLIQHTGDKSVLGNKAHPKAPSFRGESFDARDLIAKDVVLPEKPLKTSQNVNSGLETAKIEVSPTPSGNGLGDNVAKALKLVGITEERVTKLLRRPCGCGERRQKLNRLGAWAKRVIVGKTEQAKEHLETILGDDSDEENC